eukprot:9633226-Prorocentrum_lima.AAC.1
MCIRDRDPAVLCCVAQRIHLRHEHALRLGFGHLLQHQAQRLGKAHAQHSRHHVLAAGGDSGRRQTAK